MSVSKFAQGVARPLILIPGPSAAGYFGAASMTGDPVVQLMAAATLPLLSVFSYKDFFEKDRMFEKNKASKQAGVWTGRILSSAALVGITAHFLKNNPNFLGDTLNYARNFV